jgi:ABC-type nitrate/sulfonate/bicarbonate transport system substrate-binding protein
MSIDTIWYTRCPVPTAFSVAVRNGWLDDELAADGIAVQSLAASTDRAVRQAHFEQTQSHFFRHGGNIPPIVSRSRGADVRLIGLSWTDTLEAVLALPESGIETVADLRGRRLALPRRVNDSVDFWRATIIRGWQRALEVAGLSDDDVEFVEIEIDRAYVDDTTESTERRSTLWDARFMLGHQREEAAAIVRGEVDAIFSQGATGAIVKSFLGARTVLDVGQLDDRALRVNNSVPLALTVTGDLLDSRPDVVARVLARTLQAADWARGHASDAGRIVAAEVGVPEEILDVGFSPQVTAQLDVDLDAEKVAGLISQTELLRRHGFLAGDVDLDAFIAREPLEDARRLLEREPAVVGAAG